MKARIQAVQRALWALVIGSFVLGALAIPSGRNREYSAALEELRVFEQGFKRAELERSLLDYARSQALLPLEEVTQKVAGPLVPKLGLAQPAAPIQPLLELELRTLEQVREHGRPDTQLAVGSPNATPLAAAIAWRLARLSAASGVRSYQLQKLTLAPAQYEPAAFELDAEIGRLRLESLGAERALNDATRKLTQAEDLFEARRKRRLPWKILIKSDEARKAARQVMTERQSALDQLRARYETAVQRAESNAQKQPSFSGKLPSSSALALVELNAEGGQPVVLRIPVAIEAKQVKLPALAGTAFVAARDAGLWDEIKDGTAGEAIAITRAKFTWHYRYAELAGMRIGGMTVLQVLPLLLPLLLIALLSRMRHVSVSYNPFGTTIDAKLPRVGLGSRPLELAALVVLPVVAVTLTVIALLAIAQTPILPLVAAAAAIGLGGYAFVELGSLLHLLEAVEHSHSNPPARPDSEVRL